MDLPLGLTTLEIVYLLAAVVRRARRASLAEHAADVGGEVASPPR